MSDLRRNLGADLDRGTRTVSISLFDLFKIGIGPSSSHTVGPMVAARLFAEAIDAADAITVELHGSLALTGTGHGTDTAIVLGLAGERPDIVSEEAVDGALDAVEDRGGVMVVGIGFVPFSVADDVHRVHRIHPAHANVLGFRAVTGSSTVEHWYASVGGGFVVELLDGRLPPEPQSADVPFPFRTAADLLRMCETEGRSMSELVRSNERVWRNDAEIDDGIRRLVEAMDVPIDSGLDKGGQLPGLGVPRRAHDLARRLRRPMPGTSLPPTEPSDWAGVYATAVNEENAAGGRIVTAPTNGAAGIVPAVMRFMTEFCDPRVHDPRAEFLLTATAIGTLLKTNAGISGAELGCQGEVGSASAMAAAGLTAALGGTPPQVENAAEIAVEHSLGLTCDPVGGFVQVPCIERNAVGAVKAISAASLALRGDGRHLVSLDVAVETMRQTGRDMNHKYKETSLGGLAVNVPAC